MTVRRPSPHRRSHLSTDRGGRGMQATCLEPHRRHRPHPRLRNWRRPMNRLSQMLAHRTDRGITTAEYAVGTAAGAGLAGLLYKMLTGSFGNDLLEKLFDHVLKLLGI